MTKMNIGGAELGALQRNLRGREEQGRDLVRGPVEPGDKPEEEE